MERLIVFVIAIAVYLIYRAVRGSSGQGSGAPITHYSAEQLNGYTAKSYPFSEITPDPNFPRVRCIGSKIRGVTKRNADRSDRQEIIRKCCHPGDALCFVREPNNPFDHNAIQVRRIVCSEVPDKPRVGEQVGYLSRELAEEFAPRVDDDGFLLMAEILDVSGEEYGENM